MWKIQYIICGHGVRFSYVDESRVISVLEVVQHRSLIQTGELSHVLHFVELRRVHLLDVVLVYLHLRFTQQRHIKHLLNLSLILSLPVSDE